LLEMPKMELDFLITPTEDLKQFLIYLRVNSLMKIFWETKGFSKLEVYSG